jgi:hypothetical protein
VAFCQAARVVPVPAAGSENQFPTLASGSEEEDWRREEGRGRKKEGDGRREKGERRRSKEIYIIDL